MALKWEADAFTGRSDNNQPTGRVFFAPNGSPNPKCVYSPDPSADPRAHYFLFGATMYSRYQGLPGFVPVTTTPTASIAAKI